MNDYSKAWTKRQVLKEHTHYTSGWFCSDGDGAELYIELDNGGFELECFSGIPASHIYIDVVDFSVFWRKCGLHELDKPDFETQCFYIANYLCAIFCEWHEPPEPSKTA